MIKLITQIMNGATFQVEIKCVADLLLHVQVHNHTSWRECGSYFYSRARFPPPRQTRRNYVSTTAKGIDWANKH